MTQASLQRELITPEGVDLRLTLGDAGERIGAFFLDIVILLAALIALSLGVFLLGFLLHFRTAGINAMGIIWLLGFFLLRNFYFMIFELTPRAATPGKRIIGLRVASRDGSPLTANAIFARNAMRELEIFLPLTFLAGDARDIDAWIGLLGIAWCSIFILFPLFNRDRLRLGDLVAGTWVVKTPHRLLAPELQSAVGLQFTSAALDLYGIKELTILEDVLRHKNAVAMRDVAQRIRAKTGFTQAAEDAEFLSAYYVALRGRLEQRLLFGKRRRDKHDV